MDLSVFETSAAPRPLNRQASESRQIALDLDLFSNTLTEVTEIPEQDLVKATDPLASMSREDEIDTEDRDADDDTAGSDDDETTGASQSAAGASALKPLTALLNTQAEGTTQIPASMKVAASPETAANAIQNSTPTNAIQNPKSGELAAREAATLVSQSGEARVLTKRAQAVQTNENHAQGVKLQLTGAAEQKAAQAEPSTKLQSATQNTAGAAQEAGSTGREITRLEQALRQAFPTTTDTSRNPANNATAAAATTRPGADTLLASRGVDQITEASSHLTSSGERPSAMATAKAAANRPVFNLPNGRPAEQVSVQVQNGIRNGNDKIQIKLSPASLGNVEVKLELSPDKTVQAIVYADKAETLEMLERDARILQKALEEAGLRTNSDSLSFAQRDSGGSANPQADAGDRAARQQNSGNVTTDGDEHNDATLIDTQTRRAHDGLIDIEA